MFVPFIMVSIALSSNIYKTEGRKSHKDRNEGPSHAPLWYDGSKQKMSIQSVSEDEYLVKFRPKRGPQSNRVMRIMSTGRLHGAKVMNTEKLGKFEGATVKIPRRHMLEKLKRDRSVAYVERVVPMHIERCESQSRPPWNLDSTDRASERDGRYRYGEGGGEGATVYILDTGIDASHSEFDGRAHFGAALCEGCPEEDDNGHGTHVAGIIGGRTFGVAKKVELIGVKVFNHLGEGSSKDFVNGLVWAYEDCYARNLIGKCIVNVSLGGGYSKIVNEIVDDLLEIGVPLIAAAGNGYSDACDFSPGSASRAITVGSIDMDYRRSNFSNYGSCVKIFAPGDPIESSIPGDKMKEMSGTSMACPHVAGAAAIYMAETGTMRGLKPWLNRHGKRNLVKDARGSWNIVLNIPCKI